MCKFPRDRYVWLDVGRSGGVHFCYTSACCYQLFWVNPWEFGPASRGPCGAAVRPGGAGHDIAAMPDCCKKLPPCPGPTLTMSLFSAPLFFCWVFLQRFWKSMLQWGGSEAHALSDGPLSYGTGTMTRSAVMCPTCSVSTPKIATRTASR